ncbi:MAG: hypothetical protein MK078_05585 [Crocinitomicaceae bacterium]|nr:hypothetical protein [Crocinitomicaceae bacterium]
MMPIILKQNSNPYWGAVLVVMLLGFIAAGIVNKSYIATAVILVFAISIFLLQKSKSCFYEDHFEIHYKLNVKSRECFSFEHIHKVALVAISRAGIRLKIEFYDKKSNLKRTHLEFRNDGDIYNIFAILKNHRVNIVYTPE